jgi:hypothetical protein
MPSVREHYDTVLAEHYSRMFGDYEAKLADQRELLERPGVGCQGFRKGWGVAIHGNSTGVTSSQRTGERRMQSRAEVWAVLRDKEPGANSSNSARASSGVSAITGCVSAGAPPQRFCRAESTGTGPPLPLSSGAQSRVFTVPDRGALAMIVTATLLDADDTAQMLQSRPQPRHASGGVSLSKSVRNR